MGKKYNSNALTKRYATPGAVGGRPSSSGGGGGGGGGSSGNGLGGGGVVGNNSADPAAASGQRSVVDKLAALRRETARPAAAVQTAGAGLNDHSALHLAALSDPAFGSALRAAGYDTTAGASNSVAPRPRVLRGLGHAVPPSWQHGAEGSILPVRRRRRLLAQGVAQRDTVLEVDDADERFAFDHVQSPEHGPEHACGRGIAGQPPRKAARGPQIGLADSCLHAVAAELPLYADCGVHHLPLHLKTRLIARLPLNRWALGCRLLFPRPSRRSPDSNAGDAGGAEETDNILALDDGDDEEEPVERLRIGCLRQCHLPDQLQQREMDAIGDTWCHNLVRFDTVRQLMLDLSSSDYATQLIAVGESLPRGVRSLALVFHAGDRAVGVGVRAGGVLPPTNKIALTDVGVTLALRRLSRRLVCLRELVLIVRPPSRDEGSDRDGGGDGGGPGLRARARAHAGAGADFLPQLPDPVRWSTPLSIQHLPGHELKAGLMALDAAWSTTWASVERLRIYAPAPHHRTDARAGAGVDDDGQSDAADIERCVNQHRREHGRYRPLHVTMHRYCA